MKQIVYKYPVFIGEDEQPKVQLFEKSLPYTEDALEIAKREAYNGKYTIDDGEPEPETQPTQEERIAELEEALDMLLNGVTE